MSRNERRILESLEDERWNTCDAGEKRKNGLEEKNEDRGRNRLGPGAEEKISETGAVEEIS